MSDRLQATGDRLQPEEKKPSTACDCGALAHMLPPRSDAYGPRTFRLWLSPVACRL